ncbi:hypothetical protein GGQ73_003986 [Rhizobium skierniewicense]|uniref:CENP-V/GFA domain-containing protein n=1 Tax=Rhizobium skierniewicense TaxID=984260 RepID=A0A7W6C983_9HYPH|nr:GFA family protein [Rhizobium skierniewicense]MBB3948012.1 hypothetical protein [Rhizobium skierniewicense]
MTGATAVSGGCQCGAVRYRIEGDIRYPHVCHCRMCQKASGNYFLPLGASSLDRFRLTRGKPNWFQSSDHVRRGFCGTCGTPLFYDIPDKNFINVTLGSLDEPLDIIPEAQSNLSSKMHWFSHLDTLPVEATDGPEQTVKNHQHPDKDTAHWPPQEKTT